MIKKLLFFFVIIITQYNLAIGQSNAQTTAQKNRQEFGLAFYNIGFGGITAGFGSMINRKKGARLSKAFIRGFEYGCIGGGINYVSKRIDFGINSTSQSAPHDQYFLWAWPTKIVHSIGSSIIENAAANRKDVFKNYNMPIGFINLSVNFENRLYIKPQLMPIATINFVYSLCNKNLQLKLKESVLIGTPFFKYSLNSSFANNNAAGRAVFNTIYVASDLNNSQFSFPYYMIISHEHIHILQDQEYNVFNNYFIKQYKKMMLKKQRLTSFFSQHIYLDFPYQLFFYYPMNYISSSTNQYRNIFELEAQHFATNAYIPH